MTTKTEQILDAITSAIAGQGLTVERNAAVPHEAPEGGLVIVRDGTPGEPERVMGGFESAYYSHVIDIELFAQAGSDAARDAVFETLLAGVKTALYADKTFGGLAYGFETAIPDIQTLPVDGGPPIKAGVLPVIVEYEMSTPLG